MSAYPQDIAHLAATAAIHNAFSTLTELLLVPPVQFDESVLDDMLLAYDKAAEEDTNG